MSEQNSFFHLGVSDIFTETWNCKLPVVIHQGGTSSGKTWSIMQVLLVRAITEPNRIITVCGQDVPNMKKGAKRDLENILKLDPHLNSYIEGINNTDRIFRFVNGSIIEFNSYEDGQDAHSGKRDYLFVNEANGVKYEVYRQLAQRTKIQTIIDFNPSSEFWAHTQVWKPTILDENGNPKTDAEGRELRKISTFPNQKHMPKSMRTVPESLWDTPNVRLFKSNWRHNKEFLDDKTINDIERWKDIDPEYYKVYGLGEMGVIEGLVYKRVRVISEWPEELLRFSKIVRGIDFGFSDDPTVMVRIAVLDNVLYVHEEIYARKLKIDPMAAQILRHAGDDPVWSDIDPRLVAELRDRDVNIRQVNKKDKDILPGIALIQAFDEICVTASSYNLRKEFVNYKYAKNDENENEIKPIDRWNHGMDAMRYAVLSSNRVGATLVFDIDTSDL